MANEKDKEDEPKGGKAKAASDWAKAAENIAKALGAAVGLAVLVIWEIIKPRPR